MRNSVSLVLMCSVYILSTAAYSGEQPAESIFLTLPQLNWVLLIGAPGFAISQKENTADNTGARLAAVD